MYDIYFNYRTYVVGMSGIAWITAVSLIEAFALFFVRQGDAIKASLIYGLAVVPLLTKALQYEGIGIVNFIWNILSTLFGFVIGIYFFNEKVHAMQQIGVVVALAGIALIQLAPAPEGKK
jgi:multidrug transporter EmrE-like cation transporter